VDNLPTWLSGAALAIASASIGFAFSMVQRMTKAETKIEFIYDRVRVNIATAAHDPDPESEPKDVLIEKFVQKRIALSEVYRLAEILQEEQKLDDARRALRAENLLELIRYEFQLR
jgi:hypothetical protein